MHCGECCCGCGRGHLFFSSQCSVVRRALPVSFYLQASCCPQSLVELVNMLSIKERQEGLHWVLSRIPPNIQALQSSILGLWTARDAEATSTLPRVPSQLVRLSALAGHRPVGRLSLTLGSHIGKRVW